MIPERSRETMIAQLCKLSQLHKRPHLCYSISTLFFSSLQLENSIPKSAVALADYLIKHHQFLPEAAAIASSTLDHVKNPQQSGLVLSYLKEAGFSKTHLENVVKKFPSVLFIHPETIMPKIKIFQESGFSASDIADIVSAGPWILRRSVDNRLEPSLLYLKSILGSNASVCKVLKTSGWFLKHDLEKTMMVNIDFMRSCGISSSQIISCVFSFPRVFLLKSKIIVEKAKQVGELGTERNSRLFYSSDSGLMLDEFGELDTQIGAVSKTL